MMLRIIRRRGVPRQTVLLALLAAAAIGGCAPALRSGAAPAAAPLVPVHADTAAFRADAQAIVAAFATEVARVRGSPLAEAPAVEVRNTPQLIFFSGTANRIVVPWWDTQPPEMRAVFRTFAGGDDVAAERFFRAFFNRFLIAHEAAHWFQARADRRAPTLYENENLANRLAVAFWRTQPEGERLLAELQQLAERAAANLADPTPPGEDPVAYFGANYQALARDPLQYGYYQLRFMADALRDRSQLDFAQMVGDPTGGETPQPSHLYVWAASQDDARGSILAAFDIRPGVPDDARLVGMVPAGTPSRGAHHTEHALAADGLLFANAFREGRSFLFDVRDPRAPRLLHGFGDVGPYSHPHSFERLPGGNTLATFQWKTGGGLPGGLVELDRDGRPVRWASAAPPSADSTQIVPYSLVALPALDRVVTSSTHMVEDIGVHVQVWRLSDLALLHTLRVPLARPADAAHAGHDTAASQRHRLPAEPRVLADGRTVMFGTFTCGLYHLVDVATDAPRVRFSTSFPGADCAVPVVVGRWWIQTVPALHALVALDVSNPAAPVEASRLVLGDDVAPHWLAADASGRLLVTSSASGADPTLRFVAFDPATGELSVDPRRSPIDLRRVRWTDGYTGLTVPHGTVFSRALGAAPATSPPALPHTPAVDLVEPAGDRSRAAEPILDMHMHARTAAFYGPPPLPICAPVERMPRWDQRKPLREDDSAPPACREPLLSPRTDAELFDQTIATMERHNVIGVLGGEPELVRAWVERAPGRFISALDVRFDRVTREMLSPVPPGAPRRPITLDGIRELHRSGALQVLAEVTNQYAGIAPDDARLEPLWALAEELDLPVGIHIGGAEPGTPYTGSAAFRARLQSALTLEEVLVRHPRLRVYIMHAGYPLLEDLQALLFTYPQVYVEPSMAINVETRAAFYRFLRGLVEAGYGDRVMFGSDQIIWPGLIDAAVRSIEEAPFLSAEQKRDIFYNNAARFLRLSPEEVARHHGR